MALGGLLGLAWLVALVLEPHLAYSIRGGSFTGSDTPLDVGVCASSVIVHGYKCLEIDVTTRDGYILSVQRIPEGRLGDGAGTRRPVIIQHGIFVDGMSWFLNSPDQNLPMILADHGFDVWIANTRGTIFSRRHTVYDPKKPDFWNWSWDELVTSDLPAIFDFVYKQTGQKIDYVGHSLGTLTVLASVSEGKLLNQLNSAALMSPIAYLSHMSTAVGVLCSRSFMGEMTTFMGLAEFNPKGEAVGKFLKSICAHHGIDCYDLFTALTGKNCCLNTSTVDLFYKYEPQPTATKNLVHLAQTVRDGIIAKYNYGYANRMYYGAAKPPVYNLSNIPHDLPLFFSYGGKDAVSDGRDVEVLLNGLKLHSVDKISVQFIKEFAHADFIMGTTAKDTVYNAIVSFFKRQQ